MALYEGTAIVSRIVGKLGNQIFYRWKNLKVVKQAETSVLMPFSLEQQNIQDAIGAASKGWYDTLDDTERALWEAYASRWPREDPTPAGVRRVIPAYKKPQHGINAYQMTNAILASIGAAAVFTPPIISPPFSPVKLLSAIWDSAKIIVTWTIPSGALPSTFVRVWIDSQQELFHKQIADYAPLGSGSMNINNVTGALGVIIDIYNFLGSTVFIQIDFVDESGARSWPSRTIELVLPEPTP